MAAPGDYTIHYTIDEKKKNGLRLSPQAVDFAGGAERDRTVGLLNAIRNTAPEDLKFPHENSYDDDATGD